jgi:hypothetical protein
VQVGKGRWGTKEKLPSPGIHWRASSLLCRFSSLQVGMAGGELKRLPSPGIRWHASSLLGRFSSLQLGMAGGELRGTMFAYSTGASDVSYMISWY